jgi:NAD+ kinase
VIFGIIGNLEKTILLDVAQAVIRRCRDETIALVLHDRLAQRLARRGLKNLLKDVRTASERKLPSVCDVLVALGGDGTILRMARVVGDRRTPILGINLGKLGFLAEVSVNEVDQCITDILKGKYLLHQRSLLEARVKGVATTFLALNDIVLDKAGSARVVDIETYVNNEYLATFTADGIILSTPTGSTGYALSNGGPIVTPDNQTITISPICPHTLTVRPVIVPDDSVVTLKVWNNKRPLHLTADGQLERLVKVPVEVSVQRASFRAQLVKRINITYYDLLRQKLNWGRDVRQSKMD